MIFTFMRILFLFVHCLSAHQGTSRVVGSDPNRPSSPPEYPSAFMHRRVSGDSGRSCMRLT